LYFIIKTVCLFRCYHLGGQFKTDTFGSALLLYIVSSVLKRESTRARASIRAGLTLGGPLVFTPLGLFRCCHLCGQFKTDTFSSALLFYIGSSVLKRESTRARASIRAGLTLGALWSLPL